MKTRDDLVAEMMDNLKKQAGTISGYMCEVATPGCATKMVDTSELNTNPIDKE